MQMCTVSLSTWSLRKVVCLPNGHCFTPLLSSLGKAFKAWGPFFFPSKLLRAGRSSSSQEGFDFWKKPNTIWIQVWWIRWGLKRRTIFGQIQGMMLRTQADGLRRLRNWPWSEFQGGCNDSFTGGNIQPRKGTISLCQVNSKVWKSSLISSAVPH